MANRYTRLAAMYFADSLHRTNYMHRFCHRPLAAHSQKHKMKALNVLIGDLPHCGTSANGTKRTWSNADLM